MNQNQKSNLLKTFRDNSKEATLIIVLVVIALLLAILTKGKFLSSANLVSMAFQLPEFGFIALGMMVVVLTGGINLSVVNTAAMSSIFGALIISKVFNQGEGNATVALIGGLAGITVVALLGGALNGLAVAHFGVAPMLVTISTMMIDRKS
ncbi:MAG: hypothetical protein PHQ83_10430, partial [Eubacteriales bacterium]|nr:hypothetical protein [Eubacteriales bacterium]